MSTERIASFPWERWFSSLAGNEERLEVHFELQTRKQIELCVAEGVQKVLSKLSVGAEQNQRVSTA